MRKIFTIFLLKIIVRDNQTVIRFYDSIYKERPNPTKVGSVSNTPVEPTKPDSKKEELLKSLSYLKSKRVKTKKDKESINIIESVIKNM